MPTGSPRYELDLDYRVSSNRLAGHAVLHAVTQLPTSAIVLDLAGLAGHEDPAQRPQGAQVHPAGRAARGLPRRAAARRGGLHPGHPLRGLPCAAPRPVGRSGLGGALRRGAGRRPAQRRRLLVPVQRPPAGQGELPHHRDHRRELPGRVQRRAALPHQQGQPRDLGLRAGRTHGHLPGHGPDRPLRAPDAQRRPAGRARSAVCRRAGVAGRRAPGPPWPASPT